MAFRYGDTSSLSVATCTPEVVRGTRHITRKTIVRVERHIQPGYRTHSTKPTTFTLRSCTWVTLIHSCSNTYAENVPNYGILPVMIPKKNVLSLLSFAGAVAILLLAYLPLLQTIPNGSEHYFMIDVGETQIVLNRWGTLHATGYPLYVMTGGTAVAVLRAFGVSPETAPGLVSLFWGIPTLGVIYLLALHLTKRPLVSAGMIVLFGLTRTFWIHNEIAEIYTMTLFFGVLMLTLALWQPSIKGRVYWLAFLGGVAVAHHRALIMVAPALLYAVWGDLVALVRKRPAALLVLLGLGLIGLLPYAYMVMRAQAGAAWVYGEPGTLQGLIDQFMGKEAGRFIGLPGSFDAFLANVSLINGVILTDLTLVGVLAGLIGLILGLFTHWRAAMVMLLTGGAAYLFHVLFYSDILSALTLLVTLSLAFGWLFLADWLFSLKIESIPALRIALPAASTAAAILLGVYLFNYNDPFIGSLTRDPTGLKTIAMAQHTPPGATLMLAWGPRYFAAGFARDVLGLLPGIRLVDHKADYKSVLEQGVLVTAAYTFYNQPVSWWEDQIGESIYLRALAPELVEIDTEPEIAPPAGDQTGVSEIAHRVECQPDKIVLRLIWHAAEKPERDLSVFVHLLDTDGNVIAQDDRSAPVYGWRPLTTWVAGEVVRDIYTLPRLPEATAVRYGLYEQRADGSFNNVTEYMLPVECG